MPKPDKRKRHEALKQYQFKPGQSGNPQGRPRGSLSLTKILRKHLRENNGIAAEAIVAIMFREAKKGKFQYVKEIFDRIDGPVVQEVRIVQKVEERLERYLEIAERVLPREHYGALLKAWADDDSAAALAGMAEAETPSH